MGVMSKAKVTRLPERPKPPSWEDITLDVSSAGKEDMVFTVGRTYLPNITAVESYNNYQGNASSSSPGDGESELDISHTDPELVQESYDNAVRLISSYERLSTMPASLREQYSNLQAMGHTMLDSISQLKELAQSVAKDSQSHHPTSTGTEGGESRGKSRQKKKK